MVNMILGVNLYSLMDFRMFVADFRANIMQRDGNILLGGGCFISQ